MSVAIGPLSRSIYAETQEGEMRRLFDVMTAAVADSGGWEDRGRLLLDVLDLAESASQDAGSPVMPGVREADDRACANDDLAAGAAFGSLVPLVVGVILERLAEAEIASVEQAAYYILSVHPEHQRAADAWLRADRARLQAFRDFLRDHRDYRAVFEASAGIEDGLHLGDEQD